MPPGWSRSGTCTHLGCILLGQKIGESKGDSGCHFCPCRGSHYDTPGWTRKGPAPRNVDIPANTFEDATTLRLG